MWDVITNLFPTFDGGEVVAWTSNYFLLIYLAAFIHPYLYPDFGLVNFCSVSNWNPSDLRHIEK